MQGIAVAASSGSTAIANTLQTGTVGIQAQIGTPHFMSPEQIEEGVAAGPETDVWSLCVMMYLGLTGVLPFAGGSVVVMQIVTAILRDEPIHPQDIADLGAIDDGVADLVMQGLRKDPAERFGGGPDCALRMAEALEQALTTTSDEGFDFFINCESPCQDTRTIMLRTP